MSSYNPNLPEARVEDWTIYYGGEAAAHSQGSAAAEVDFDEERGLYVRLEEGSGYMSMACSHRIPLAVLFQLLRNAGYVVEKAENIDD